MLLKSIFINVRLISVDSDSTMSGFLLPTLLFKLGRAKILRLCPYSEFFWSVFSYIRTPYLSLFSLNAEKYGPEKLRIRKLFTKCHIRKKKQPLVTILTEISIFLKSEGSFFYASSNITDGKLRKQQQASHLHRPTIEHRCAFRHS